MVILVAITDKQTGLRENKLVTNIHDIIRTYAREHRDELITLEGFDLTGKPIDIHDQMVLENLREEIEIIQR